MLCADGGEQTQRLRQVEEQGESLRADLERLCQRVAALEAAASVVPEGSLYPAEATPLENELPPLELGSEPAAGEDNCRIEGAEPAAGESGCGDEGSEPAASDGGCGVEVQESTAHVQEGEEVGHLVKLPRECIDDVYTFSESMWDVQLFLGRVLGPANSLLVMIYSVVNIAVQVSLCIVVWDITSDTLTNTTLQDFRHWRLSVGHAYAYYDPATNSSLARRTCAKFGANNVAASQQSSIANLDAYFPPLDGSIARGPVLATMAILIWTMTVMIDLWSTVSFLEAVISLARQTHGGWATKLVYAQGRLSLHSISRTRALYATLCIVAPRVVVDILLLLGGINFLLYENTLPGLILNAVALGFILGLDELIFLLLPRRAKRIVEIVEPVEKKVSFANAKGRIDLKSALILLGCVVALTVTWGAGLNPKLTRIREAQRLLCEGDLDFVYDMEAGTGGVVVSATSPALQMQPSHRVLAVLQRTGLPLNGQLSSQLSSFIGMMPANDLWKQAHINELSDIGKKISADFLLPLECKDHDDDPAAARALHSLYYDGGYGDMASRGSFCDNAASWCTSPERASLARKLCAHTCRCDSTSLVDRYGCNNKCHVAVEDQVSRMTRSCSDVSYRGGGPPELRAFYANLLDFLVREGKVQRSGSRTSLTPAWRRQLVNVTGGRFTMVEHGVFPLSWNLTHWLSTARAAHAASSPCIFIPFVYRIFGLDLCAAVGDLGTLRGFCPQACRAPGCPPAGPDPRASFDRLLEEQMTGSLAGRRIIVVRLGCGLTRDVPLREPVFFERPAWGNSEYTLDYCGAPANRSLSAAFSDMASLRPIASAEPPACSLTALLNQSILYAASLGSRSGPSKGVAALGLHCHTDGTLTCGGVVRSSTVGAASTRGGPAGERIFEIDAPDLSIVSFETCGSQLDARLSVYDFSLAAGSAGSLYRSQDATSSCGGANGASLTLPMPFASSDLRLVVEGHGPSEGNFTLRTACRFPLIQCGDTINGSTLGLRSTYGGASPEMIWRFNSGSGGNITIDTCNSTFDTDIWFFSPNMTKISYVDANPTPGQRRACGWKAHWTSDFPPNLDLNILLEGYGGAQGDFTLALRC